MCILSSLTNVSCTKKDEKHILPNMSAWIAVQLKAKQVLLFFLKHVFEISVIWLCLKVFSCCSSLLLVLLFINQIHLFAPTLLSVWKSEQTISSVPQQHSLPVSPSWHVLVSDWNRLVHPAGQKHHLHQELVFLSVRKRCGKPDETDKHDCGQQQDLRQPQWGVLQVSGSSSWWKTWDEIGSFWSARLTFIVFFKQALL